MKDTELFELCKEVYKRTCWEGTGVWGTLPDDFGKDSSARIYTSDYILEKIPRVIQDKHDLMLLPVMDTGWSAFYEGAGMIMRPPIEDTPLKALLKLVIALHEAGELN